MFRMRHVWVGAQTYTEWGLEWTPFCKRCGGEYRGGDAEFPELQFPCISVFTWGWMWGLNLIWKLRQRMREVT